MRKKGETESKKAAGHPATLPRVLVSVLSYNSPGSTIETLRSLKRQCYSNYHLLLVDNASDEDTLKQAARELYGREQFRPTAGTRGKLRLPACL